jgi:hypothetical protein
VPPPGALGAGSALAPGVAVTVPSNPTSVKLGSLEDNTAFFEKMRRDRRILCGRENARSPSRWGGKASFNKVLMRAYDFFSLHELVQSWTTWLFDFLARIKRS